MQKYYKSKIDRLNRHYQAEIQALKNGYDIAAHKLKGGYDTGIHGLITGYEAEIHDLITGYETETHGLITGYEKEIHELITGYEKELHALKSGYDSKIHRLISEFHAVIAGLNEQNEQNKQRHEAMAASTSWRVTKPLRVLMGLLRSNGLPEPGPEPPVQPPEPVWQPPARQWEPERQWEPVRKPPVRPPKPPWVPPVWQWEPPQTAGYPARGIRVVYLAEGPSACVGYDYRCAYYARAMAALGARTLVVPIGEVGGHLADIGRADVLIIWRSAFYEPVKAAVTAARANGAVIIFDIDDLIFEPDMATVSVIDGMRFHNLDAAYFELVRETAAASDFYTAPTHTLALYLRRFGKPVYKLANGFDDEAFLTARLAARRRKVEPQDGLFRIGYAGGTKTHQKDFGLAAQAVARILNEYPQTRLVLFVRDGERLLDISEFPELKEEQIEWRDFVPHERFPAEIARFDVSLAPLEAGNPFCESKSELKFFESALSGVCVIASPTEPYKNAVEHGVTGFLAETGDEWYACIKTILTDGALREKMAADAFRAVLWPFGYQRRVIAAASLLNQIFDEKQNQAALFAHEIARPRRVRVPSPAIAAHDTVFYKDALEKSYVTVAVPLYNYENYVTEALDSVKAQTLENIDLVIVDDKSTDNSLAVALAWAEANAGAFNRVVVAANRENAKLDMTRNTAFELAETPYVFPLDPDNRLLPDCLAQCLDAVSRSGASFAYPLIRHFGGDGLVTGHYQYNPSLLSGGNFIDAMALIAKSAWAEADGYRNFSESGWEDFSLWCTFAEKGMTGVAVGETPLAEYRVHENSMLRTTTDMPEKKRRIISEAEARHPWLTLGGN